MNTKKKTILAAAFVVAIIALAGIGYAAAQNTFTGKTTSASTNVYDVDYVVVQLDADSYTYSSTPIRITYDEETVFDSTVKTKFKWTGSDEIQSTVKVDVPTNATTPVTSDPDTYKLTVALAANATPVPEAYTLKYSLDGSSFTALAGSELSTGKTLTIVPGTQFTLTIYWTIEPTADMSDFVEVEASSLLTQVAMPALVYTVTGTQYTAP